MPDTTMPITTAAIRRCAALKPRAAAGGRRTTATKILAKIIVRQTLAGYRALRTVNPSRIRSSPSGEAVLVQPAFSTRDSAALHRDRFAYQQYVIKRPFLQFL